MLGKDRLNGETLIRAVRYAVERTLLGRELKDRDEQYRMIVETAEEGIWRIDSHDRTVFVNRKMAGLLQYTPAEMMSKTPFEFMDEEWKKIAARTIAQKRNGSCDLIDFRYQRKDGTALWTRISTNPLFDDKGAYCGAVALVTDISERKAQEEALKRLADIVESSSDAILGKDLDGFVTSWNRAAEKLFGYTAAEAIGRSVRFIVPPERQTELDGILSAIRKGNPVLTPETLRRHRNGKLLTVSITDSPIRDAQGKILGSSAIARDISERKTLEAQFHQAQKMEAVGRLAGGVAHDFNNLLTVICGYTSLLLSRETEGSTSKQELEEIYRAGERAAGLTRQLLAFSRKQILQPQVVELNPVIRDLEKMLHRLIGEDIELSTSLQDNLGRVKVDIGQMDQVVMNLAINARDAMPHGGRLMLETRNVEIEAGDLGVPVDIQPGCYVMLAVSDNGVGMDKEIQSHLFEPFFTTKGLGKGTGLGLSTIYGIVRQSGGHINVYSEPGKGTSFRIYLPSVTATAEPAAPAKESPGSLAGTEKILVVEDNELVRKLTSEVLQHKGYRVKTAASADEALDLISREGYPQLLLSDMVLPGMDGLTLCRKVATRNFEVKTMLMTGYTEEAILRQGVSESGVPLVHKPFSPSVLLEAVRRALTGPESSSPSKIRMDQVTPARRSG